GVRGRNSDNRLIHQVLSKGGTELKEELEILLAGQSIEKHLEENIIFRELDYRDDLIWSLLLMSGYLKQTGWIKKQGQDERYYALSIPNREVRTTYVKLVREYFDSRIGNKKLETMLKALVSGDINLFEEIFSEYVVASMSFFDTGGNAESIYHAFVMGLLLWLTPEHEVKSNRESGYGRYDI
ncbi:MAG: AAA family ATPase, partial [bacterium]|nr:AAA family ATPase [bacterium]